MPYYLISFSRLFAQPGGLIATKYGAKYVFGIGVLGTALLTLLTPLAAPHTPLLIALRVLMGVFEV